MLKSLAVLTAGLAAAGIAYYCLCLFGMFAFLRDCRRKRHASGFAPLVSILKPLRGTDPEMYESFRSYCLQDYSEYQIIFGVSDANDPAVALVEKLISRISRAQNSTDGLSGNSRHQRESQQSAADGACCRIRSLIGKRQRYSGARGLLAARARAIFGYANVGMVTCLYRGVASHTLGSRLESIGTSTDFCPAVLAARQLQGVRFGLGSTLAFSRKALNAAGGFDPLLDYLADDYELGARIAQAGFEVRVSEVVVDHFLPGYTMREFLDHQLRWARAIRDSRRWGYAGLVVTFPLVWAAFAVLFSAGACGRGFCWWRTF